MSNLAADRHPDLLLLTPEEMARADSLAEEAGIAGIVLMEAAGAAATEEIRKQYKEAMRFAVLAGPGNNGGDAHVVARRLSETGCEVVLFQIASPNTLKGDAATAAAGWRGTSRDLATFGADGFEVIVDGLFGAGLSRPVTGEAAAAITKANRSKLPVVAIDLPSGISGLSGAVLGVAIEADLTVTFFRKKPGHLLLPGRRLCGQTVIVDIGIPATVLDRIPAAVYENRPDLWRAELRSPDEVGHKYDRGHAVVFSGGATTTGAARMAAMAALRGGAGLVTLFSPASALLVNAAHLTAIMLKRCNDEEELATLLEDERLNAFVLGPGFGVGEKARRFTAAVLGAKRPLVLDADGITSFKEDPGELFRLSAAAPGMLVLTPHMGEFGRLFPDIAGDDGLSKLEKARAAAKRSAAVIVLKGSDTVIAHPDGMAAINATGSSVLATAGTGDVLAGIIVAQLAQGMPAFQAAAAAVWMHAAAACRFGPGLIAEDLPALLPGVLAELFG